MIVCCAQQAWACSGGCRISGRSRVQRHRRGAERAADLTQGGGALHAVVAVLVVAGEAAELVPGQLGGLAFPVRGLFPGGGAGGRPGLQQRARCLGAVQVAVGDDRAVVGAFGPAVVGVQVLDELGAGGSERDGPGSGVAVGVAGVAEDVAERDLLAGHRGQRGSEGADRVVAARRQRGAAGELGDGRPVFLGHHDPGREIVAVEQLVLGAQQVVLAVAPGGLGVGAGAAFARRRPGEGVHVRPVDGQRGAGVLELLRDGRLEQVIADALQRAGRAGRRARPRRGCPRPGRRCTRSAGR